ncbi:hypothetical protein V9T40_000465 [Parthenolecanium corni]|uniref:Uncharacterized protein n=1 Tax=Parthenolecanium corni TaxID=536013 RepID=A0AAN9Y0E4_9HEMI
MVILNSRLLLIVTASPIILYPIQYYIICASGSLVLGGPLTLRFDIPSSSISITIHEKKVFVSLGLNDAKNVAKLRFGDKAEDALMVKNGLNF